MKLTGVQWLLVFLLGACAALHWFLTVDYSQPNVNFLYDMGESLARESQTKSIVFDDGRTQQLPPEGAIAKGYLPFPYANTPEDMVRAGEELVNPFSPADAAALARGGVVFQNKCAVCHGAGGMGDGLVTQRGVPAPPSLLGANAKALKDGAIYHLITYGRGAMSSHASQVSRDDRWKVILHIRKLQQQ